MLIRIVTSHGPQNSWTQVWSARITEKACVGVQFPINLVYIYI